MGGDTGYIGDYRVVRRLGAGGMGEVFLVEHPRLPRQDALKLLDTTVSRNQEFRGRFMREANLLAPLRHANIITIYDRGDHDGQLWLTMEYIAGQDTARLLKTRSALPMDLAMQIIAGAGAALDYAYGEHQITHRDVKPANILVECGRDNRLKIVKLADFGIAKAVGESTSLTSTGVTVGTMAYISPEALEGRIFERALAKDPDSRFQSCMQLVEALGEPRAAVVPHAAVSAVVRETRPWVTAGPAYAAEVSDASVDSQPWPSAQHRDSGVLSATPPVRTALQPGRNPGRVEPFPNTSRSRLRLWRAQAANPTALKRRKRPLMIVGVVILLTLLIFGVGRKLLSRTYYLADYQGTVAIMQGLRDLPDSFLGVRLNGPFMQECLNARGELSEIRYGQSTKHCRLLRVDDLQPDKRAQLQAGMGDGGLATEIDGLRYLSRAGLLPICSTASPPQAPPAELPSGQQSGIDCRPAA
ncbi:serine/threonine-protein kinase [Mycobacterium avium]|uniref:serine/threonine-protein kinase n=3 Tax=Mycobacterium avium TaxID=1764 RepID=UPI001F3984B0|nr:serine/threonine-protein kinase [Mycobacterium avium]